MNLAAAPLLILWACAAAAAAAPPARATTTPHPADHVVVASAAVSMDEAVKLVEQRFRARVVKAETEQDGGRTVYVLKLLDDSGRVRTVHVDAANGEVQ
jgi:uncharacterized membrane protein YkoI